MQFEYEVKRSARAKRVRISVKPDARVVLTLPRGVSERRGKDFVNHHQEWIIDKLQSLHEKGVADQEAQQNDYRAKKEIARKRLVPVIESWAQKMNLKYNRVAIKKTSTRWGSCSSKGNINLHYRLAFIDEELMEYVVIHELAHLVHMNHSNDFWGLVETWCPEWKDRRKQLRKISTMSV